jgi:hypothetical protein
MQRASAARVGIGIDGLVRVGLVTVTIAAFLPVLWNGFVDWDDTRTFIDNPHYRGLGWAQLRWMVTESHYGHYVPLAWATLGADYLIWGMNPTGYHLTSLLIHVAATLTLYAVSRLLITRAGPVSGPAATTGAAAAALLFALHPLRVESVAWATERRDVLSGLFVLLTVLAYVRSTDATGPTRRWLLGVSVVTHLAALLSKSITIMVPVVLALLDVYPLRRLGNASRARSVRSVAWLLSEKAPHAALSLALALITHRSFNDDFANRFPLLDGRDLLPRVLVSLWFYPIKTLVPMDLSPLYEVPMNLGLTDPLVIRAATGLMLVTLLAWLLRHRCPGVLTTWLSYGILLAPVAGAVPLGYHLTADRYSYVPCLGFAVLAGGAVAFALDVSARQPRFRWLGPATVAALAVATVSLATLTWHQARVWRDTASLWEHAVRATPACVICQVNRGYQLLDAGAPDRALQHFHIAYELRPSRPQTYGSLATAFEALGRPDAAIDAYRAGLAVAPNSLTLRLSLASALLAAGRLDETVGVVDEASRFYDPTALASYYGAAAQHRPEAPVPRLGLVRVWTALGDRDRARGELERLRQVAPGLADLAAARGGL